MTRLLRSCLFLLAALFGLCEVRSASAQGGFGGPLPGLTRAERARFEAGKEAFEEVEGVADGVGPVFNRDSCVACHDNQASGGGSAILSTRIGTRINGRFDPLLDLGGPVIQTAGVEGLGGTIFEGERIPDEATIVAGRRTPQTFGLGLVDAVPDGMLWVLAFQQRLLTPDTAGRPHFVTDLRTGRRRIGRLGWKAAVPDLTNFSGDAYKEEMGITTPGWLPDSDGRIIDEENPPQGDAALLEFNPVASPNEPDIEDVVLFADFMTFLAPPPRGPITTDVRLGEVVFARIGCADCHVPTLLTGNHPSAALRFRLFSPFSDFLLHDMGELGDGIEQGEASGHEMRTAPLWGLRTQPSFLHDGRARTVSEAILQHAGQGTKSRNRFRSLSERDRTRLIAFLDSL